MPQGLLRKPHREMNVPTDWDPLPEQLRLLCKNVTSIEG